MGGENMSYLLLAPFQAVPQFRGAIPVTEAFFEKTGTSPNDFWEVLHFTFVNAVMGWNLGGGWEISRECWRKAVVEICSLEPGDMYLFFMEPVEPFERILTYWMMDMAKGPLDAEVFARVPYAELEGPHPMEV